jgi:hypothetical protein
MKRIKFVGMDVHAETIVAAVAGQEREVRSRVRLRTARNRFGDW